MLFVLELVFSVVAGLIWGPINGFIVLIVAATAGGLLRHLVTNLTLMRFSVKHNVFNLAARALLPAVSIVLIGLAVYGNFFPVTCPAWVEEVFAIVVMAASLVRVMGRKQIALEEEARVIAVKALAG